MKKLLTFLILIISLNCISQTYVLANKDTLVITSTTTTKTGTVTYTYPETVWTSIVRAYKPPVIVDTIVIPSTPTTYQGFGALAVGGSKSTDVRLVSNKAQFDAAIGSNRTIKFTANTSFTGRYDLIGITYLTIDANGYDVTIDNAFNGDGISFDGATTHHCILTGIRVINAGNDNINVLDGAHDIVIDHCSVYDSHDGGIDIAGGAFVTIQYCFIGKGAADWSGGTLLTAANVTIYMCLYALATPGGVGERGPLVGSSYGPKGSTPNADIRDNLCWNWGRSNGTGSGFAIDVAYGYNANVVNNYVKTANSGAVFANGVTTSAYGEPSGGMYAAGNVSGNGINANAKSNHAEWVIPAQYKVNLLTAIDAANKVKAGAGTAVKNTYELSVFNSIIL